MPRPYKDYKDRKPFLKACREGDFPLIKEMFWGNKIPLDTFDLGMGEVISRGIYKIFLYMIEKDKSRRSHRNRLAPNSWFRRAIKRGHSHIFIHLYYRYSCKMFVDDLMKLAIKWGHSDLVSSMLDMGASITPSIVKNSLFLPDLTLFNFISSYCCPNFLETYRGDQKLCLIYLHKRKDWRRLLNDMTYPPRIALLKRLLEAMCQEWIELFEGIIGLDPTRLMLGFL